LIRRELTAVARPQGVAVAVTTHVAIIQPVGDQSGADRISLHLSAHGATEQAYLDLVFVRVGRGIAVFSLASVGTVFDQGLEPKLLQAVVGRLAADLAGGDVTPGAAA
jgi:hypothetical protein